MATIKNGFLSGKVGEIVGYTRNGKNLIRRRPKRTAPPTAGELLNQHLFGLVQEWVSPLNQFLRQSFRTYTERVWGANAAKSLISRHALQRHGYDSYIDPSLVQVSAGSLALPENLQAELMPAGYLEFSWSIETSPGASPRDRIMMLAYNIQEKMPIYELWGAKRMNGRDVLSLAEYPGGAYHIYAVFVSEDLENRSDSRYLGMVEV